jgi:hypothetical protein
VPAPAVLHHHRIPVLDETRHIFANIALHPSWTP